jgi:hypothetical protein
LSWRRGFFGQSRDFLRPGDVTKHDWRRGRQPIALGSLGIPRSKSGLIVRSFVA